MPKTPMLLWGGPGCGKSEGLRAMAERKGFGHYAMVASQEDPVDICGVIVADNGHCERKLPSWWLHACQKPHVLVFEELTTCNHEQHAAVLRATDDSRELCGHKLHEDTIVVATANPPEEAAGAARELPPPVLSRFRHRRVDYKPALDWLAGGQGLVIDIPIKPPLEGMTRIVASYLNSNPGQAQAGPDAVKVAVAKQEPFVCLRAWTRAAAEEGSLQHWHEYIGLDGAAQFIKWFTEMDLPDPRDIIAGTEKRVPPRGDGVSATAGALAAVLGDKPTHQALDNAVAWYTRAAEKGFKSSCIVEIRRLVRTLGASRMAKYPECFKLYGQLLSELGK